jgi:tetratricopeptide (TPR) repeat protein
MFFLLVISCSNDRSNKGINPLPNFEAFVDDSKPDSTEIRLTEILPLLEMRDEFSISDQYKAELFIQIARAQALQNKFAEAEEYLIKAEKLINDKMPEVKISWLLNKGSFFFWQGQKDKALEFFESAHLLSLQQESDYYAIKTILLLSSYKSQKDLSSWLQQALDLAVNSTDLKTKMLIGDIYSELGKHEYNLGDYLSAKKYFSSALELYLNYDKKQPSQQMKWAIALCQKSLYKFEEALHILLNLQRELEENNIPIEKALIDDIVALYDITGRYSEALELRKNYSHFFKH